MNCYIGQKTSLRWAGTVIKCFIRDCFVWHFGFEFARAHFYGDQDETFMLTDPKSSLTRESVHDDS